MPVWNFIKCSELEHTKRIDAEYYQPSNMKLMDILLSCKTCYVKDFASYVTDGIHDSPECTDSDGILYLSAKCVKENDFVLDNALRISHQQHQENKRSQLMERDILVTTVGTIGNTSVVTQDLLPANVDRHVGIIRIPIGSEMNPWYLSTFMNSRYGRFQTIRESTGNVQLNLFIPKIRGLVIPQLSCMDKVARMTEEAFEKIRYSQKGYFEAEEEMLERLEWSGIQMEHDLSFEMTARGLLTTKRTDAEHFQPKYARLLKHLNKKGALRLGDFCPIPHKGVTPIYDLEGSIPLVNTQHLGPTGIDVGRLQSVSEQFYNAIENTQAHLKQWDVLVYGTGAYLGRTNCWLEKFPAMAGMDCLIIQPDKNFCDPVYLALFLNSEPGLLQSDKYGSGSAQRHLYPRDLIQFFVFIPTCDNGKPDLKWQEKLAEKVISASRSKADARKKMNEAKALIEKEIESN
jgi:hypothetical protein